MRTMVRSKLKSRRGASIIIALLVLLICITAGAAALTAAGANAGRYTHMRTDQQRYLSVASAARLVRSELCGQSFTATAEITENRTMSPEGVQTTTFQLVVNEDDMTYTGIFEPWLSEDLKGLFKATAVPESWWNQAGLAVPTATTGTYEGLGMDVDSDEPLLDKVCWTLALDDDYTLTARFYLLDDGAQYYPMVLTIPATKVRDETSEPVPDPNVAGQRWTTTRTVEIQWRAADAVITQI